MEKVKPILQKLLEGVNLTSEESYSVLDDLTSGKLHESQIGSFLTAMQIKKPTSLELASFASVLKTKAQNFPACERDEKRLDVCGTGGSKKAKTINVSTISSFILAAAGANVVKHGNRGVTSKCGSADLLEELGFNIEIDSDKAYSIYNKLKLTFLYARSFHKAMKFAAPSRKALGFRTIFNIIGPLSNPAHATHQLIGTFDQELTEMMCNALNILGIKRAMVVYGLDGLDEISLTSPTQITELNDGWIKTYTFKPEDIGLKYIDHNLLTVSGIEESKQVCYDILNGKESEKSDLVFLNSGAALYIYGLVDSIKSGYELAKETSKTGKPIEILNDFIALSKS